MEKNTIRAFELNDFPFGGGVFSPKFSPVPLDLITIENKRVGVSTQLIQTSVRLGQDIIPKGAIVTSRLQYSVRNITQNYCGVIELVGIQKANGDIRFFVSVGIPLSVGDKIEVEFSGVILNSNSSNVH